MATTMTAAEHLHTEQELADVWDVSLDTVRRARKRGEYRTIKLGREIRIPHLEFLRITGQTDQPDDDDPAPGQVRPIR